MKRIIVHSDINHCYAQLEEMRDPALRHVPMAVGGSAEKRHGIILAKNDLAKKFGVKTGEPLTDARRKCPDLKIIHPDYEAYMYYTEKIKDVYRQYTDRVESFGLDEAWLDLSGSERLFGDPIMLAKRIQREVFTRYGVKVSMGVSWNKVYAKLGSDLDKDMGFTLITPENYQRIVWPLGVGELIMVGRHTEYKLNQMGIFTIGDLATADGVRLAKRFGKMGGLLWKNAQGRDSSPVDPVGTVLPEKSIGNSRTLVKDVCDADRLHDVLRVLCESVACRLRAAHKKCWVVSVSLRGSDLRWYGGRQKRLKQPTDLAGDLLEEVWDLVIKMNLGSFSIRSLGVHTSDLVTSAGIDQLSLFDDPDAREKERSLEEVLGEIRTRYGYDSCRMASMKRAGDVADFDPLGRLHQVHPIGYLKGPIRP